MENPLFIYLYVPKLKNVNTNQGSIRVLQMKTVVLLQKQGGFIADTFPLSDDFPFRFRCYPCYCYLLYALILILIRIHVLQLLFCENTCPHELAMTSFYICYVFYLYINNHRISFYLIIQVCMLGKHCLYINISYLLVSIKNRKCRVPGQWSHT